jgi:type VI secretion system protein ImpF
LPELTHKERLQPSLLDRLTDDEPDKQVESREQRVFSLARLREAVLRDVAWLLNTTNLEAGADLSAYPEVRQLGAQLRHSGSRRHLRVAD